MHKIIINRCVAYVTQSGTQKVAGEFLEIKLFSYTAFILERKTNITSIEKGKEDDLGDEGECRMIIWLGEFFAGRDGRVLGLGCYNYAEITYEATDHRLQKVIQQCPQQPQPPSDAWEESISLTSLTQTTTKIKCSILVVFIFQIFLGQERELICGRCLRNYKGDDSTQ